MAVLLHIDASVRTSRSLSRGLSEAFVRGWRATQPEDVVIRRDLGLAPPPHISESWIAACFTPPDQRSDADCQLLAVSDEYIDELTAADVIVIGTPMYNYGMPAVLKGWIDQVVRVGRTFSFDLSRGDFPLEPVLAGKTLVLLTSSGEFGFAPGGIREGSNHLDPHIATVAPYLGVRSLRQIRIEYQEFGDMRHQRSIADAHAEIPALIAAVQAECRGASDEVRPAMALAS